ncbi:hypothetical protein EJ05DRAFT_473140 [Pseudovirgaria hyperparasitica]|uniref:Uncharacterized protein n=1 Tax=Pseudovirgaria hyperparasitica TaxID=470096 RepID=A0A6A6WJ54_9PEZI|nr:uncharacterized protein EJ05DRAFT_473140 [Pseudovirgaria hyperparasitica]KAF2762225.1 hypothetical protein EJ05DRAFT_473140 [Pseudovirgaria hyperparasitica]
MKIPTTTIILTVLFAVPNTASLLDTDALLKRQEPGTPAYNCHAACGGVLTIGRGGGEYCDNAEYQSNLQSCLDCANTYNIWYIYGNGVSGLAKQCQDDATPSPSGFEGAGPSSTFSLSEPNAPPTPTPNTDGGTPTGSNSPTDTGAAGSLKYDTNVSMFAVLLVMSGVLGL